MRRDIQGRPPHAATLPPAKAAQPKPVNGDRPPHPATVALMRAGRGSLYAPHPATLPPWHVAQRMEKEEEKESGRNFRKRKKVAYFDEDSDSDDYKNPNYEKEKEERNKILIERTKQIKFDENAKKLQCWYSKGEVKSLTIVDMPFIKLNWKVLAGNEKAEPLAVKLKVNGECWFFRTSYGMDLGLAPLSLYEGKTYSATTNRTYKFLFLELDDAIGEDKQLRKAIGKAMCDVRDNNSVKWGEDFELEETDLFELDGLVAEMGAILALDLIRAGDQEANAKKHQNELVCGKGKFIAFLDDYVGMKAAALRDPNSYKK